MRRHRRPGAIGKGLFTLAAAAVAAGSVGAAGASRPAPAGPAPAPAGHARRLPDYATDRLALVFSFARPPARACRVEALRPRSGAGVWEPLGTLAASARRAALPVERTYLAEDGSLRLRFAGGEAGDAWVYLLPVLAAEAPGETIRSRPSDSALRSRAIAYARVGAGAAAGGDAGAWTVSLDSHLLRPSFDGSSGDLAKLELDGEPLPGVRALTQAVTTEGTEALRVVRQGPLAGGSGREAEYLHRGANPLRMTVASRGDRLVYRYQYTVRKPVDRAVAIRSRFPLPGKFRVLESLNWRRTNEFTADARPQGPLALSQLPFVAARSEGGAYLGVLDQEASSLMARVDPASNTLNVEMWIWPKTVGQVYGWTFELLAGYEGYGNAFLRALNPHTRGFRSALAGGMQARGALDTPASAKAAFDRGARVVWLHGWFDRNGRYFDPARPADKEYTSISKAPNSYARLKQEVEQGRAAGLKVFVYFQFAGVSEDIASEFGPSLVRNRGKRTVRAGQDGGIANLWANPNPDLVYGKSFLRQVEALLAAVRPDGIALDRADRLDFTYGTGYDFGGFDGYASPQGADAAPAPASSVTYQGKRLMRELRRILDRHNARLISNLPITPLFYRWSDGSLIDQPMTPWKLFFMRASSNGKPFFIIDTTRPNPSGRMTDGDNNAFLGHLTRSHPHMSSGQRLTETAPNSRLQYVVEHNGYPALWLFADGTALVRYDGSLASATTTEKFAGSSFVPLPKAAAGAGDRP